MCLTHGACVCVRYSDRIHPPQQRHVDDQSYCAAGGALCVRECVGHWHRLLTLHFCARNAQDQVSRVTKMLNDEAGTASNIKSRVNRLSVLDAIGSTLQRLKLYNRVPQNGLVIYSGVVMGENGKEKQCEAQRARCMAMQCVAHALTRVN